ncbi:Crp/Fnr family transcriptional regulator [Actinomycetospora sp. NBRC 106378]|uniref:Crp/Fnr family transcriptional regulator n=1 Tax=Actinomycetospora sp. NBRC 106378 TaxID=3032208 RepID=UPI00249FD75C|nr:Crp/Fnr family transcriptional regulator [Actinomycetospora sp. NBRC 106378]GLZ56103.1 Crp/Fnr family transcriptional regulator [Actinomycetospora sp. NBRC 106378]
MELLADMSAEDRRQVLASGRRRRFSPREVVFHEGDPADTFLLIDSGRVAVRAATPMGDTVTFAVVGPGETVGELALIDPGARRSASVLALEATEAWSFGAETFHRLRRTNAGADAFVLQTLAAQVRRLSGLLVEALHLPVETRVLRRLTDLERQYRGESTPTLIPLTQEELASLAGASRATVNKVLRTVAAEGLLELRRGRVAVLDPAGLERAGS